MTRKHFDGMARALRDARPTNNPTEARSQHELIANKAAARQWQQTVEAIARECRNFNTDFHWDSFMKAAGITDAWLAGLE